MKKIILLLLISLSVASIHAQTNQAHKRDSLQSALQKEKTDSGRVLLLAELSFQIHEIKPDTAMILALEALELSRRIGFEKGEAVSLNRVGNVFSVLGNYLKALEAYLNALKINEKIENLDGKQRNLSNIGYIYFFQGD
ncbi:MAG TPA: tetratricopeptide repeat protein, partial [Chitinophagaceae bacterium]|nr:tetratricopeptide repeat protein [Chitinophagaceae bacterium]